MALVIGHRGCPPATENTLAAIRLAAERGADAVEIDCRLTRDGDVVLEHDALPVRTAWIPVPVRWLGARAATSVPLRGGGRRPTLAAVLSTCRDLGLAVMVDLKERRVAAAVATEVLAAPAVEARAWSSHADALMAFGARAPGVPRALLNGFPARLPDDQVAEAAHFRLEGVTLDPEHLTDARIRAVGDAGLELWSSTPSLEGVRALAALIGRGVPLLGFITDHTLEARTALG